jgi:hypothetical protein
VLDQVLADFRRICESAGGKISPSSEWICSLGERLSLDAVKRISRLMEENKEIIGYGPMVFSFPDGDLMYLKNPLGVYEVEIREQFDVPEDLASSIDGRLPPGCFLSSEGFMRARLSCYLWIGKRGFERKAEELFRRYETARKLVKEMSGNYIRVSRRVFVQE